jgi:putative membrane protein
MILLELVIYTAIAFVSPRIVPGVKVRGIGSAVLVALVFGLLNFLVGWLLTLVVTVLSLPLTCLSLGLFKLLIPTLVFAALLKITDAVLESFELEGWWPALAMGLLFSLGSFLTHYLA